VALSDLYRLAQEKIRQGNYGEVVSVNRIADKNIIAIVEGQKHVYFLKKLLTEGDIASVYRAEYTAEDGTAKCVCLKIIKNIDDNEFLENERQILGNLKHVSLPNIVEAFELGDGRAVTVLSFVEGYNFHELRNMTKHSEGLDNPNYHLGWILERQLAVLGYLHSQGVVHGSVEPAHLIVQPENHNVVLMDFCWAKKEPSDQDHIKIAQEYYSPPEIYNKAKPHPSMDIYGVGKSAIYLIGGDPEYSVIPDRVHSMYKHFLERMTEESAEERATDAYQLAHHLVVIREEVSGKEREFVSLSIDESAEKTPADI